MTRSKPATKANPSSAEPDTTARGASPLDVAETAFGWLVTGPAPLTLHGRDIHDSLPCRPLPLDELRDLIFAPGAGDELRDAARKELLTHARAGDPTWVTAAVGMALPALRRRCQLRPDAAGDAEAHVLTTFRDMLRAGRLDLDPPAQQPPAPPPSRALRGSSQEARS